ncbi:MAG: hypothetical protein WCP58_11945 [bacterium]
MGLLFAPAHSSSFEATGQDLVDVAFHGAQGGQFLSLLLSERKAQAVIQQTVGIVFQVAL